MFSLYPPTIGNDLYEKEKFTENCEEVVCDKCGKAKMPSDMIGNICSDCHMESIEKELDEDMELTRQKYKELEVL